jgi:uncharacterized protein (DUF488 family)
MRLYTIGHSSRTLDELVDALRSFRIRLLVDIRTIPRSRHTPQFNREALSLGLPTRGIRYTHLGALGGLRKPRPDSQNTGWRNAGFRGFADYMETPAFAAGLEELRALAGDAGPAAFMCAEAVPWRCHRSLVADALTAGGDTVLHIMRPGNATSHVLTSWAEVDGIHIAYPGRSLAPGDEPSGESRRPRVGTKPRGASRPRRAAARTRPNHLL